jgi:anti-sigma factor RsiW
MRSDGEHVDLLGLLSGELPPAQRSLTLDHIRGCEQCRSQLAETAALVGELRDAGRHSPVDPSEVPPLDLAALRRSDPHDDRPMIRPTTTGSSHEDDLTVTPSDRPAPLRRRLVVLGVAVGLVVAVGGGIAIGHSLQASTKPSADVRLAAVGPVPTPATGAVRMVGSGADQTMEVRLSGLTLPAAHDTVEVWLLNTRTGRTHAIGTMPATNASVMTATFPLPASDVSGFDAVDVSIQSPANGGQHSGDSVLRGQVA